MPFKGLPGQRVVHKDEREREELTATGGWEPEDPEGSGAGAAHAQQLQGEQVEVCGLICTLTLVIAMTTLAPCPVDFILTSY